jgi:hypothetical protein
MEPLTSAIARRGSADVWRSSVDLSSQASSPRTGPALDPAPSASSCAAFVLLATRHSLRLYPASAVRSGSRSTLCKERFETAQDAAMLLTPSACGGAGVVTWTASKGLLVRHS